MIERIYKRIQEKKNNSKKERKIEMADFNAAHPTFLSVSEHVKNCFHGVFSKRAFLMPFNDRSVQNIFDEKLWVWIDRIGFFVVTKEVEVVIFRPKSQRHLNEQFASLDLGYHGLVQARP